MMVRFFIGWSKILWYNEVILQVLEEEGKVFMGANLKMNFIQNFLIRSDTFLWQMLAQIQMEANFLSYMRKRLHGSMVGIVFFDRSPVVSRW